MIKEGEIRDLKIYYKINFECDFIYDIEIENYKDFVGIDLSINDKIIYSTETTNMGYGKLGIFESRNNAFPVGLLLYLDARIILTPKNKFDPKFAIIKCKQVYVNDEERENGIY